MLKLGLVAVLFLSPFFVAVGMRFGGWQPAQTRNFGELLAPPLSMAEVTATQAEGSHWTWVNIDRRWTLLLQLPAECAQACIETVEVLARVRESLGRRVDKLVPFALSEGSSAVAPDLARLTLTGALPTQIDERPVALPQVWLVDPHGYLVMRYREGFDPSGLRRDLARLIK